MAQTDLVRERIRAVFPEIRVVIKVIRTEGDVDTTSPLTEIGGRGVFTNAIETAVLRGHADAAVHSAKDLPTGLHPDAPIVAIPDRDDPRDALVSRHGTTLNELPPRPVIGTSSQRRAVQIAQLRPDARIVSIRGNLDTRLRKAAETELDAIVLAVAGLRRMGWESRISETFTVERLVPSPGQGAIAIQARAGGDPAALLEAIDDPAASVPVIIERAFLAAVGAGCSAPVGAHVMPVPGGFRLIAMLADLSELSASRVARADETLTAGQEVAHAAEIATRLAARAGLRQSARRGGGIAPTRPDLRGARVVVTRPRRQADSLMAALAASKAEPLLLPTIRIEPVAEWSAVDAALCDARDGKFDWIAFTSANAAAAVASRLSALGISARELSPLGVAAVGPATAAAVAAAGLEVSLQPLHHTAESLATTLRDRVSAGSRVLYPRSAIGSDTLPELLRQSGIDAVSVAVYRTVSESSAAADPGMVARLERGEADVFVFASPSSVHGLLALVGDGARAVLAIPAVCAGTVTAEAAQVAGFTVAAVSRDPDAVSIVDAISDWWHECSGAARSRHDAGLAVVSGRSAG